MLVGLRSGFGRGKGGHSSQPTNQTAVLHGDVDGPALEMVAHPQGEEGGEGAVVQGILSALDGHALGLRPQAEEGEDALGPRRQGEAAVAQGGEDHVLLI